MTKRLRVGMVFGGRSAEHEVSVASARNVLEAMDRYGLWKDTLLILTTDHGTFNGDRGRIGKLQTARFYADQLLPQARGWAEVCRGGAARGWPGVGPCSRAWACPFSAGPRSWR